VRRFYLQRDADASGISGTGVVAEGVVFTNGRVVLTWLHGIQSIVIHASIDHVITLHGHDGRTTLRWIDTD
jgi:hypothetical protein